MPTTNPQASPSFFIDRHEIKSRAVLAPMAGITDLPFRNLCRQFGAGFAVSEMVASDVSLRNTTKSRLRICHEGEASPRIVQIVGTEPAELANAAKYNYDQGAEIIDINMGCPAKKVCKKLAGSALLKDPKLVEQILLAVVKAVPIPVTLKIRTGWSPDQRNGVEIAQIAENCGIASLAVHGRTRACRFKGNAEYDTIRQINSSVKIPVIANGDISTPENAKKVLDHSGATCIMIGRGAQGRPWIFQEINHFLETGETPSVLSLTTQRIVILKHLQQIHEFYGEITGIRIARKHIGWYTKQQSKAHLFQKRFNSLTSAKDQIKAVQEHYERLIQQEKNAV